MTPSRIHVPPISSLLDKHFYVPAYQRGYRWTARQVRDLLDDIWTFQKQAENQQKNVFYCLQPIVVRQRDEGDWELIDGQQRLTTIFLILSELNSILELLDKRPFSLSFETRPATTAFLQNMQVAMARESIDVYHLRQASQAIRDWFKARDGSHRLKLLQCLLNGDEIGKNVKVLWCELSAAEDPVQAFTRLNMGKIALTNAELVRALFLREENFASGTGHLQRAAIAREWDDIEKTLQGDDIWHFLYNGAPFHGNRIGYLFELIAREAGSDHAFSNDTLDTFWFFQEKWAAAETDVMHEWLKVKQFFMLLQEWFADRTLYHLIGYLVNEGEGVLALKEHASRISKSAFRYYLKQRIFQRLTGQALPESADMELSRKAIDKKLHELGYENTSHHRAIRSVLLLFNIAALLESSKTTLRFPFNHFKQEHWDIEHIHATATVAPASRREQMEWLEDLRDYANLHEETTVLRDEAKALLDLMQSNAPDAQLTLHFQRFHEQVLDKFDSRSEMAGDNGIGNLTLLDSSTNRSYKNAVFPVKRMKIIASDKHGVFVPLCTKNVFMKYFSDRPDQMTLWTQADRNSYRDAIAGSLTQFFSRHNGDQP